MPDPKEEIPLGFNVAPVGETSFNERYDALRREIESARKDLRNGGWQRLYKALGDLVRLSPDFTLDAVCRTILGKSSQEVFEILQAHQVSEQLAAVGFDDRLLRGDEATIDRKLAFAGPKDFNHAAVKQAVTSYKHLRMWNRKTAI
jgi:hypothetical protein